MRLFTFFLIYGCLCVPLWAQEQLAPKDQVIHSNYLEQLPLPVIGTHRFDPRRPERISEPYSPPIRINHFNYPDQLPKNIKLSWITRISGPLSRLFLGYRGVLEQGVQAYLQEKYPQARQHFQTLSQKPNPFQSEATLWLAWSNYKLGLTVESQVLAKRLEKNPDLSLQQEGYFLHLLYLLQKDDLKSIANLLPKLQTSSDMRQWGFRLRYLLLAAQVKLAQWPAARKTLTLIQSSGINYSPYYAKLKEIAGVIAYYENDFLRALTEFRKAQATDPRAFIQSENNRYIAWLHYFNGDYPSALKRANQELNQPNPRNPNEFLYLKIATLTHLNQGEKIKALLLQIPATSPFRSYAAFQVKLFLKDLNRWPDLKQLVSQVHLKFPALRFYVAILEGNEQFQKKNWAKAAQWYKKARSHNALPSMQWIAVYNSGLIHLAQGRWSQAQQDYKWLQKLVQPVNKKWLSYHLLYLQYNLDDLPAFLQAFDAADFSEFDTDIQWEVHRLKGSLLKRHHHYKEALTAFLWGVNHGHMQSALEYATQTLYGQNQFQPVITLLQQHQNVQSDPLLNYEVRSLMALGHVNEAQKRLESRHLQGNRLLQLHVDLWTQSSEFSKVIKKILPLRQNPRLSEQKRKTYTLFLADAYFNQHQYPKARLEYQKVLDVSRSIKARSSLLYTLSLSRFLEPGKPGFVLQTEQTLKKEPLTPTIRLNLTLLLSQSYVKAQQLEKAQGLLGHYEAHYLYQRGKVRVQQVQISLIQKDYALCAKLASTAPKESTVFEQTDLSLLGASCLLKSHHGAQAFKQLQALHPSSGYRIDELNLSKAQALGQNGQFAQSRFFLEQTQKTHLSQKQLGDYKIALAANHHGLGDDHAALQELGGFRHFSTGEQKNQALLLQAKIQQSNGALNDAIKTLLRLSYSHSLSPTDQINTQLDLIQVYLQLDHRKKARATVTQLKKNLTYFSKAQHKRLKALKQSLRQKPQ